jgi:predicted small metal-binding protein
MAKIFHERRIIYMKTMTCRQIGGPCDTEIHGETVDEMMNNGTKHVRESNDEGHKKVVQMMEDMQKDPEAGKKWTEDFSQKFAELPED